MSFTDVNRPGGGGDWAPRGTNPFEDHDDDHGDDLVEQAAVANQETRRDNLEEAEAMAFQLTTRVAAYRRMVDLLGTRKDTMTHRENLRGVGEDVSSLAKRAAHVLRGHKPQGKRQKSRHRKLTRDVQQVLEEFQKAQRLCAERKAGSEPVATPVKRSRRRQREREAAAEQERPLLEEDPERAERERMAQEQVAVEGELELNNAVLQEREEDIKEIQFQIGEVTEIFQDLAVLVSEQGEVVDDMEANIVNTYERTEEANKELKKAAKHQRAARLQLCTIFMIVMVGIVMLAMFMGLFKGQ